MTNLLQQRAVDALVSQYSEQFGLPRHKAFLYLVIEKFFLTLDLGQLEIEESIVDGQNDCGIDAIVIDEESEDFPQIYFFQSKYYETQNAFERAFEGDALDKLVQAVDSFVLRGIVDPNYQNERLVDRLHSVKNLNDKHPRFKLVFCSNSLEPVAQAKKKIQDLIKKINNGSGEEYLKVEYLHLERLTTEFVAPSKQVHIDLDLQISGKFLTEDTGYVRLFVGAVEGRKLAELVEKFSDDLFEQNVRGYLKKGNPINRQIIATATGKSSPYFVYMNNGVTMTCKKFKYSPTMESPNLEISDAQIVNGQQTMRSIFDALKQKRLKDDVKVLVRIVETEEKELLSEIIEATNSQNKVTSRDLRSNDAYQKLIERSLGTLGYFYEARKNKYQGKKEVSKRIDAMVCAQAYYACKFEEPAFAKDKKKQLFGDKYDEIFNDETNPKELLACFQILQKVQKKNNEEKYSKTYTFLLDAALHVAALIYYRLDKNVERALSLEESAFDKIYKSAVTATAALVRNRSAEEGDKYEHRKTFIDPETFGRIVQIMSKK